MFRQTIAGGDTSRQIGFGIAMGTVIGLLPKDSLLTYLFGVVLLISTANLLSALVSGFVFSWIGFLIDPISHSVGRWMLTRESLQAFWRMLYEAPIVPWTRFENTVVMGSLIIGLSLFLPMYLLSTTVGKKYGPVIHARLNSFAFYRWISGSDLILDSDEPSIIPTEATS